MENGGLGVGMDGTASSNERMALLHKAMLLKLRREREMSEAHSLKLKKEWNKTTLNEFRYGPVAEQVLKSSEARWVLFGDHFAPLSARDAQSLVMKNQMQIAKHLEETEEKLEKIESEIDETFNKINSLLQVPPS